MQFRLCLLDPYMTLLLLFLQGKSIKDTSEATNHSTTIHKLETDLTSFLDFQKRDDCRLFVPFSNFCSFVYLFTF